MKHNYKTFIVTTCWFLGSLNNEALAQVNESSQKPPQNPFSYREICKKIDRLEKQIASKDSLLKLTDAKLMRLDYVEKNFGTRLDDVRDYGAIITALLLVIAGFSYQSSRTKAAEVAHSEFEEKFAANHKRIKKIESDAEKLLASIKAKAEVVAKLDAELQQRDGIILKDIADKLNEYINKGSKGG